MSSEGAESKMEQNQAALRREILRVQGDTSLSAAEKTKRVQELMMRPWLERQASATSTPAASGDAEAVDAAARAPTLHPSGAKGCKHYMRRCKLRAACCGKVFTCRLCHDEVCDHAIDRHATREVVCMECGDLQPVAPACRACGVRFARYYCEHCKFYEDDATKRIYHCPHCGICRLGQGLDVDYFHCHKCNACMSIAMRDGHKCVEDSLKSDCPICHQHMFTSTTPVTFLPCGHCIHMTCYDQYARTNYVCPVCSKSLGNMGSLFVRIDHMMREQAMPREFADHRCRIFCCDCEQRSVARFHFLYHKCSKCGSYNTKVLERFLSKPGDEFYDIPVVPTATAPAAAAAPPGSTTDDEWEGEEEWEDVSGAEEEGEEEGGEGSSSDSDAEGNAEPPAASEGAAEQ